MSEPVVVGPTEVHGAEAIDRIARFRFEVWEATGRIVPEAFPGRTWRDALDDVARHFVLEADGRLAAAVRYAQFDRLDDMPEAAHYRRMGVDLPGPFGLPERLVVDPRHKGLKLSLLLYKRARTAAEEGGARYLLVEASAPIFEIMMQRGRKHLGPAAYDPRFPGVRFELVLVDMSVP